MRRFPGGGVGAGGAFGHGMTGPNGYGRGWARKWLLAGLGQQMPPGEGAGIKRLYARGLRHFSAKACRARQIAGTTAAAAPCLRCGHVGAWGNGRACRITIL